MKRKFWVRGLSKNKVKAMNCNQTERLLFFFNEQSLTNDQTIAVKRHLDHCIHCQKLHHEMKEIATIMEQPQEIFLNPFFETRAEQRLINIHGRGIISENKTRYISLLRTIPIAISIVLAIVAGMSIGSMIAGFTTTPQANQESTLLNIDDFYTPTITSESIESILLTNGNNN